MLITAAEQLRWWAARFDGSNHPRLRTHVRGLYEFAQRLNHDYWESFRE